MMRPETERAGAAAVRGMDTPERNQRREKHVLGDEASTVRHRGQLDRRADPHDEDAGQPVEKIRRIEERQHEGARSEERRGIPGAVNLEREEPFTDAARRRATPDEVEPEAGSAYGGWREAPTPEESWDAGRGSRQSETTSLRGGENVQGPEGRTQGMQNSQERMDLGGQSSEVHRGETIEDGNEVRRRRGPKNERPGSL